MSKKATTIDQTHIHYEIWLRLASDGGAGMTRTPPSLAPHERAMKLTVSVPRSVFRIPQLRAEVSVPDQESHDVLTATVVETAGAALREALNCDVRVSIGNPEEDGHG